MSDQPNPTKEAKTRTNLTLETNGDGVVTMRLRCKGTWHEAYQDLRVFANSIAAEIEGCSKCPARKTLTR